MNFEPKIVGFVCKWCCYKSGDFIGTDMVQCPSNIRTIRVICSGRIEPTFILKAFQSGADGVLVLGCPPGDCHYTAGNYKARRRMLLLKKTLAQMGIEEERLRLDWVSASENDRFISIANEMTEKVKAIGPLGLDSQ